MKRWMLLAATLLLPATASAGETLEVCTTSFDCYFSVGEAYSAASDGDTILVHPGWWTIGLNVQKSITLRSVEGSEETTLAGGTNPTLQVDGAEVLIEGFTLVTSDRAMRVQGGATATLRDIVVSGLSTSRSGSALRVQGDSTVILDDSRFENVASSNSSGGGCIRMNGAGSSLTITDTQLLGCRASNSSAHGGAIRVEDGASLSLDGVTILNGQARQTGGGLSFTGGGALTILDSHFETCQSESHGGAIAVDAASAVTLHESSFTGNRSGNRGGAIVFDNALIDLLDVTFDGNQGVTGGHLYLHPSASGAIREALFENGQASSSSSGIISYGALVIEDSVFADNVHTGSSFGAGALRLRDAAFEVRRTDFVRNITGNLGGAIYASDGASLLLEDVHFEANSAASHGGAIEYASAEDLIVLEGTFEQNAASGEGGAIRVSGGAVLEVADSAFTANESKVSGGAIAHITGSSISVSDSVFEGNIAPIAGAIDWWHGASEPTATVLGNSFRDNLASHSSEGGGGAVFLGRGHALVEGNRFEGNQTGFHGGALRAYQLASFEGRWNRFCGNTAGLQGGAVQLHLGSDTPHALRNNAFIENAATSGGGVRADDGGLEVMNNTFVGNEASSFGGAYENMAGGSFSHNVVAHTPAGHGAMAVSGGAGFTWNLFFDNVPAHLAGDIVETGLGAGNLFDVDPAFMGYAPGDGCEGDLRPLAGSPLIHGGDPDRQNLDGNIADIGLYGGPDANPDWWVDGDGDTWPWVYDCDDEDPDIHPGADSYCDGIDNNCDGVIDGPDSVDAGSWWPDNDGDTFGDMHADPVIACEQPEGHVDNNLDCNDDDEDINPDADSYCDGVDNNCDGVIDGPDSLDATTWYEDSDGDGFGNEDVWVVACEQPEGFVSHDDGRPFDCDDDDPYAWPGAPEICNGKDNSCSGVADDPLPEDAPWWWPDADGDGFGDPEGEPVQACDLPEGYADNDLDCDDDDPYTWPGAPEICNGKDNSCSGVADDPLPEDAPWWWPDADGDGFGDAEADPVQACEQPEGYVDNDLDCDDTDPDVYPGAPEPENDCDHVPDEEIDNGRDYTDRSEDEVGLAGRTGCGCAAGPASPAPWALLLGLLAVGRRRSPSTGAPTARTL